MCDKKLPWTAFLNKIIHFQNDMYKIGHSSQIISHIVQKLLQPQKIYKEEGAIAMDELDTQTLLYKEHLMTITYNIKGRHVRKQLKKNFV